MYNNGNHDNIPNHVEMFSTMTPRTRMNVWMQEPWVDDEWLDPQHGEVQHCIFYCNQFVVANINVNPMGALIFNGVSRTSKKTFGSTSRTITPNNLLGPVIVVYQTPLFFNETFVIINFQLVIVFQLVVTLYEGGGTLRMGVVLNKDSKLTIFPHVLSNAN